jgi:hypothetical protein
VKELAAAGQAVPLVIVAPAGAAEESPGQPVPLVIVALPQQAAATQAAAVAGDLAAVQTEQPPPAKLCLAKSR